jgi:pyruvate formate lyase activating enzyme
MNTSGTIFNIQRHSVHDGPGIRTILFLKGCPLSCLWCSNPESQAFEPELFFDPVKCIACGACLSVCPASAISKNGDVILFCRELCTACGKCAEVCYAGARRIEGHAVTAEEAVAEVIKDKAFFARSGGGLTLSGGEPLAQPDFAEEILRLAREKGLNTVVETAGHVPWSSVEKVLPYVDLFLYDIKHTDPVRHKDCTGADNLLILENLEKLKSRSAKVVVRVPVIPGFNDTPADLSAVADIAFQLGIREMHLLPGHRYGSGKYRLLGEADPMAEYAAAGAEKPGAAQVGGNAENLRARLEAMKGFLAGKGLTVRIGG